MPHCLADRDIQRDTRVTCGNMPKGCKAIASLMISGVGHRVCRLIEWGCGHCWHNRLHISAVGGADTDGNIHAFS